MYTSKPYTRGWPQPCTRVSKLCDGEPSYKYLLPSLPGTPGKAFRCGALWTEPRDATGTGLLAIIASARHVTSSGRRPTKDGAQKKPSSVQRQNASVPDRSGQAWRPGRVVLGPPQGVSLRLDYSKTGEMASIGYLPFVARANLTAGAGFSIIKWRPSNLVAQCESYFLLNLRDDLLD